MSIYKNLKVRLPHLPQTISLKCRLLDPVAQPEECVQAGDVSLIRGRAAFVPSEMVGNYVRLHKSPIYRPYRHVPTTDTENTYLLVGKQLVLVKPLRYRARLKKGDIITGASFFIAARLDPYWYDTCADANDQFWRPIKNKP